ncbi:hypothetical protein KFE25_003086 [Diacronema lutheri]|uniref:Uncharacterized protein n=2 Tax=Diacronema lutheri TaxID=2081491 RepID=A0A8J5X522_DIALT|nr:hypothetical protein KFE25_003086 [Diacronema lutheri]
MAPKRAMGEALSGASKRPAASKPAAPIAPGLVPAGWALHGGSVLVRDFAPGGDNGAPAPAPDGGAVRVAGFDFDGCLAETSVFRTEPTAWKLRFPNVPSALRELHAGGYRIVIVTNESTDRFVNAEPLRKCMEKKAHRVDALMREVGVPCLALIALRKDEFRKPSAGAWRVIEARHAGRALDITASFFVGDAAGRPKAGKREADHSSDDLGFARSAGIAFFNEEQFFVDGARL